MLTNEELDGIVRHGTQSLTPDKWRDLIAQAIEANALRERVLELENRTPEHIEIDLKNAGAGGLAMQLLKDDGSGEMSPGPCADALKQWRKMKRDHEAMNVLRRIDGLVVEWNRANGRWEVYQSATKRYHYATDPADALLAWRDKHILKQKKGSE